MGQRQDRDRVVGKAGEIDASSDGPRDTIYALASGMGRAGVAIVRLSGPKAAGALSSLTRHSLPAARMATFRRFRDRAGDAIDEGLALWFEAPGSFTGEDVVELHVHGGRAVLDRLFRALDDLGLRPAERGEFTRRAVESGRLDLTKAEGIADLVNAETEAQRRQALRQFGGEQSRLYESWRADLIRAGAYVESSIDFADEDLPDDLWRRGVLLASQIDSAILAHLNDGRRGELLREGLFLTVVGPPNAGKSSLVNALARRDVAIVSERPGTTRDIIETRLDLQGFPITIADTAGLRVTADAIEAEGTRRALAHAEVADLVLLVLDGSLEDPVSDIPPDLFERASLVVWNKVDLVWPRPRERLAVSTRTGQGLPELLVAIAQQVRERLEVPRGIVALTCARHRHCLEACHVALERAKEAGQPELCAEDLRLATRELGRITGRADIEELLGVVFREFCIGK